MRPAYKYHGLHLAMLKRPRRLEMKIESKLVTIATFAKTFLLTFDNKNNVSIFVVLVELLQVASFTLIPSD